MSQYTGARSDEIFVGNTPTSRGMPDHMSVLRTARLGEKALDIEGRTLPGYLPIFIGRSEADAYDRIMTRLTFPNKKA